MKQTVVFDFDGVIHSYRSGWQGPTIIPDSPVCGIKQAIAEIRKAGYEVVVVSTRSATAEGKTAIREWLDKYDIVVDDVCEQKPPAIVYIDDRAICFDGNTKGLLKKIQNFRPWYKTNIEKIAIERNWLVSMLHAFSPCFLCKKNCNMLQKIKLKKFRKNTWCDGWDYTGYKI